MMWWGWHGFFPFGFFFLMIIGLFVIRCFGFRRYGCWRGDRFETETVLQRRLASGEITIEEYQQLKEALK